MKSVFLIILMVAGAMGTNAQSLKDALFKGKLKKDSATVIRKTDDLSSKLVDTTQKANEASKPVTVKNEIVDSASNNPATLTVDDSDETSASTEPVSPMPVTAPVKSNNKLWKEFTDSLVISMEPEINGNKKLKKGTYYLTVEYEISAESEVSIVNVIVSPDNDFLANQVKDRLTSEAPILAPSVDSSGKAKKVKRKYNFTITKD